MPRYEYECSNCGTVEVHRAAIEQMNDPGPAHCGIPTTRKFSPTSNIFISQAFASGLSWSDFHGDLTERDLAKTDYEPINRLRSRPSGDAAKKKKAHEDFVAAAKDGIAKTRAEFSAKGLPIDG